MICRLCAAEGASHVSPSGRAGEVYCDACCVARCGLHRIEDFVYDERIDRWVDPCVLRWQAKKPLREHWQTKKIAWRT